MGGERRSFCCTRSTHERPGHAIVEPFEREGQSLLTAHKLAHRAVHARAQALYVEATLGDAAKVVTSCRWGILGGAAAVASIRGFGRGLRDELRELRLCLRGKRGWVEGGAEYDPASAAKGS